jgi:protein-tyrosine phosphatase
MIDIHCHVLPGIDDGPNTVEEALALARACVVDGVFHTVATPHVFPGRFDNRPADIARSAEVFRELLDMHRIPLSLSYAGEVRLSEAVIDLVALDRIPYLGVCDGFRTMLLELPDAQIPLGAIKLVSHLLDEGVRPVLVHPERNKAIVDNPERVLPFVDAGCYLQITAASLTGQFGPRVLETADYLLSEGLVSALASDAHNLDGRPPRMRAAYGILEARYGLEMAEMLCLHGPARLCGMPKIVWGAYA